MLNAIVIGTTYAVAFAGTVMSLVYLLGTWSERRAQAREDARRRQWYQRYTAPVTASSGLHWVGVAEQALEEGELDRFDEAVDIATLGLAAEHNERLRVIGELLLRRESRGV